MTRVGSQRHRKTKMDIMSNKGSLKIFPARIRETASTHHFSRKTLRRETELEPTGADDG